MSYILEFLFMVYRYLGVRYCFSTRTGYFNYVLILGQLSVFAMAGCAPGHDLVPVTPYNGETYRLGTGDKLRVITFGEQSLSQDFLIGDGGDIAVPLIGNIHVADMTSTEVAASIQGQLRDHKFFRDPSVVVEVETYRPISVLGEVAKPGQYPYQPGMTMLTAVAVAGGFTYRSVETYAYVVRPEKNASTIGRILPQDYVKPGDVIKIYERLF